MITVTHKYKIRGGYQRLYAVGDRQAVLQAIRNTFTDHKMPIHDEKDQTFKHYPGGWYDRAMSAADRFYTSGGSPPQSDCFSVKYSATNNPLVTTLLINLYHKVGWFKDAKVQARIKGFYAAFEHEFRIFQLLIVDAEHWSTFTQQHPSFFCSPVWKTAAEIEQQVRKRFGDCK